MFSYVKCNTVVILTLVLTVFLLESCSYDTYVPYDNVSIVVPYSKPYYDECYYYYHHKRINPLPPTRYYHKQQRTISK